MKNDREKKKQSQNNLQKVYQNAEKRCKGSLTNLRKCTGDRKML